MKNGDTGVLAFGVVFGLLVAIAPASYRDRSNKLLPYRDRADRLKTFAAAASLVAPTSLLMWALLGGVVWPSLLGGCLPALFFLFVTPSESNPEALAAARDIGLIAATETPALKEPDQ